MCNTLFQVLVGARQYAHVDFDRAFGANLLDLPAELVTDDGSIDRPAPSALKEFRDGAEREFIIAALRRNHGNISQSALELGVGRTYLHRRLTVLNIGKKDFFG